MKETNGRKRLPFAATVLRLLRANRDFGELSSDEKAVHVVISADNQVIYQSRIGTARLGIERKKLKH